MQHCLNWVPVNCFNLLITHARSQDLGFRTSTRGFRIWISGPGFQALNARFQDLDLRTWVSGPQREVSGPGYQDLGFRTSKALHPTVVLSFSRHFSLRPVVTDRRTHAQTDYVNLYIRCDIVSCIIRICSWVTMNCSCKYRSWLCKVAALAGCCSCCCK